MSGEASNQSPEEIDSSYVDKMQPIEITDDIQALQEQFSKNSANYLDDLIKSMNETANDDFERMLQEQELLLKSLMDGS